MAAPKPLQGASLSGQGGPIPGKVPAPRPLNAHGDLREDVVDFDGQTTVSTELLVNQKRSIVFVEAEVINWMRRALSEERHETERFLTRRHEDMLLRLRRMAAQTNCNQRHVESPHVECQPSRSLQGTWDVTQTLSENAPTQATEMIPDLAPPQVGSVCGSQPAEAAPASPEGSSWPVHSATSVASSDERQRRATVITLPMDTVQEVSQVEVSQVSRSQVESSECMVEEESARYLKIAAQIQVEAEALDLTSNIANRLKLEVSHYLDGASAIVILLFVVMMAVWTEYRGTELLEVLQRAEGIPPAEEAWPHARPVFTLLEWAFGIFFCMELIMRFACGIRIWADRGWNALDAVIVLAFVVERLDHGLTIQFHPTVLRMARLSRLMRLLKVVRHVQSFDALHLIVKAISSSMSVLIWTVAVLLLIMMGMAMVNASFLEAFINDPNQSLEDRKLVYERWGTFIRAFVSMFEITMDSWGSQCWLLVNGVSDVWGFFFIAWKCCIGFAVIMVIEGVFIQHTFRVASRDEDIMIQERQKACESYLRHLDNLFTKLDEAGDGVICRNEFVAALQDPRVRHWFEALEIDASDGLKLFMLLDNGNGQIGKDEFIVGLKKIKGVAQSIDMVHVVKDCQRIRKALGDSGWKSRKSYLVDAPGFAGSMIGTGRGSMRSMPGAFSNSNSLPVTKTKSR